ncbi:hypothetical protein HRH25_20510 [Flavisolibacter sp. BT320]|nr:hypothetical protein [Flavisolibacter longurius]
MFKKVWSYRYFLLLLLGFLTEIVLLTCWRNQFGSHKTALAFFVASLAIGGAALRLSIRYPAPFQDDFFSRPTKMEKSGTSRKYLGVVGFVAMLGIVTYAWVSPMLSAASVGVEQSDIIAQTQVLVQRFLQGQVPYQWINFGAYNLFPTYQPMQWLPYSLAELAGIDYRKLALLALLLVTLFFAFYLRNTSLPSRSQFFLALLPFLPIGMVAVYEPSIYTHTLENLVVAYYFLFCMALSNRSLLLAAAAMVCCLLSRYAIVVWVPLFLWILAFSGGRKKTQTFILLCATGIFLLYGLPFLSQDSQLLLKGFQYHTEAALGEWKGQAWQQAQEKPFQLFRGLGFAGIFYDHYNGSLEEKLRAFQWLHRLLCAATCVLLAIYFFIVRKRVSVTVFALASLKIYLAVFYHFIQIPYDYLFLTLLYASVPLLVFAMKRNKEKKRANTPGQADKNPLSVT